MKKIVAFLLGWVLTNQIAEAQTTAVNFTAADCSGSVHTLYDELDAGKIIVVSFVMPCIGCVIPTQVTQAACEGYASTYPGRVEMWLSDDDAGTPCTDLINWRNSNGIHLMPTFSTTAFVQAQYGTPAMPKIVVMAGTDHRVYGVFDNVVDTSDVRNAIDHALGLTTGIRANATNTEKLSVYPNPAQGTVNCSFSSTMPGNVVVRILDGGGRVVKQMNTNVASGTNKLAIPISGLSSGIYTLELSDAFGLRHTLISVR